MNKKLICNGIIVNEGFQSQNDILIEGDKIIEIKPNINPKPDIEVIDAEGHYVLPGIIDDQVHFREPGLTHKATIEVIYRLRFFQRNNLLYRLIDPSNNY